MRSISSLTATIHSLAGVVENAIFSVNLVDGGAPASGIVFTEDITKIADQQGRDAVGHGVSPLGIECGLRYLDPERLYCGCGGWHHRGACLGCSACSVHEGCSACGEGEGSPTGYGSRCSFLRQWTALSLLTVTFAARSVI